MAALALAGDHEAYRQLVERHRDALYRIIWGVLRHPKDAEDALQETLVRIYLSLPQYRQQGFKTWIGRIEVNLAIDAKRRRMRKDERQAGWAPGAAAEDDAQRALLAREPSEGAAESAAAYSPPAEVLALARERKSRIRALVDRMPAGYRSVVRAFYFEDKPQREIALEEQIEVKSVESKLYRAKQWMRKHWKEEDLE